MPRISYVNGQFVPHHKASVHIEDRGLQFSDSVYEVFALIGGQLADEAGHLDRLERSLKELGIEMPMSRRALQLVMRQLVRRNKISDAALYLQVTRGVAPRDFRIPRGIRPALIMTLRPTPFDIPARKALAKKAVTVADIRWGRRDIKTTQLLAQVMAREHAAVCGVQEAWLVDGDGFITEASASNAWIVDGRGNLLTRPVNGSAILKGVTRSTMQMLCRKEKMKIIERPFTVQEAYKAKEAFTSSANALFVSITEIDGRKIGDGKPGPVVSRLYDIYMDYVRNKKSKQERWSS
jgi:D-alanine transaminase